jgi:hypothetical protein
MRMMIGKMKMMMNKRKRKIKITQMMRLTMIYLCYLCSLKRVSRKLIVILTSYSGKKFKCKFDGQVLKESTMVQHFEKHHKVEFKSWSKKLHK